MGGKKPLRRPLWPPTRATASNYYPLGLDGAGGAAKPLLRAPKKPAPLHGRLPAFSGAVDAFERARKCFLEWRYFFSIILSEFLKNRVALQVSFFFGAGDEESAEAPPAADEARRFRGSVPAVGCAEGLSSLRDGRVGSFGYQRAAPRTEDEVKSPLQHQAPARCASAGGRAAVDRRAGGYGVQKVGKRNLHADGRRFVP